MSKPLAVVAVGGNVLIADSQHIALADPYAAVCATATHVTGMDCAGWNVVLTHGNDPQVGFIPRRSEIADGQVPTVPVQYAVGDTQGAIGFMFQAERYAAEGHFGEGRMAAKVAVLRNSVRGRPGGRGVITNPENIERALRGETGTWIEA